jgi:hypothetical protein
MRTVSSKETSTHSESCDSCKLWYSALHPSPDGRFLCRMCLEVSGLNQRSGRRTGWPR